MKKNFFIVTTVAAVCCMFILFSTPVRASGQRSNVISLSMGRATTAFSRGLEAVGTNPANLVLPHRGRWAEYQLNGASGQFEGDSLGIDSTSGMHRTSGKYSATRFTPPSASFTIIPPFGVSIGTDFLNYDLFTKYFTGTASADTFASTHLFEADKQTILDGFPGDFGEIHSDLSVRWFGLTIHNDWLGDIAFTGSDRVAFDFDLPRDYARFILYGLDSAGSSYDFSGTDARGWWLRDYAFSYARKISNKYIDDFSAGITVKMVQGFAVAYTDHYDATLSNPVLAGGGYGIKGNFDTRIYRSSINEMQGGDSAKFNSPLPTPAGTGLGFDLGISGEVSRGIRTAISVIDIGSINWTENTKVTYASALINTTSPTSQSASDSIKNALKGTDTTTGGFSTSLPTQLNIGAAFEMDQLPFIHSFPGQMVITLDYQQGFNTMPGNSTRPRIAMGMEWRPTTWFPLRSGISLGGVDRFNWAAGFGFDFSFFNLNIGTSNIDVLTSPNSFRQLSAGMSMIWRI